jgi:hypothetical protein
MRSQLLLSILVPALITGLALIPPISLMRWWHGGPRVAALESRGSVDRRSERAQGSCLYKGGQGTKRVGPPYRPGPDVMLSDIEPHSRTAAQESFPPIDAPSSVIGTVNWSLPTKSRRVCKALQPASPTDLGWKCSPVTRSRNQSPCSPATCDVGPTSTRFRPRALAA